MTFRTIFLPFLLAAVLVSGGVGLVPVAHAQTATACTGTGPADEDCPPGSTCNVATGICERTITVSSCLTTGCPAGSVCSVGSGQCVDNGTRTQVVEQPATSPVGGGSTRGDTARAAGASGGNDDFTLDPLTGVVDEILNFIDSTVVPAIFAIAFIVFIWGIYTYFILGGANEEKRSEGKQLAFWGLIGFFVMVSVWGLVNILVGTLGPNSGDTPCLPQISGECAD